MRRDSSSTTKYSVRDPKKISLGSRHHTVIFYAIAIFILSPFLTQCASIDAKPPPSPVSASITPSPTIAFPTLIPTATITPEPSPTPTPDIIAGLADLLLQDKFDQDRGWESPEVNYGGSGIVDGRFSLAVRQPSTFLIAIEPSLLADDFLFEVSVRSELCTLDDEYGILFRVNPDSEHYRFTLTCDGEARVSRTFGGSEAALIPKTQTNAVFNGLLVENRLGVLAVGEDLRFFINGIEVFSVRDTTSSIGKIGFIVRSRRGGQTTASFDDLDVYALLSTPTPKP
jgi:hypothetical protein